MEMNLGSIGCEDMDWFQLALVVSPVHSTQ